MDIKFPIDMNEHDKHVAVLGRLTAATYLGEFAQLESELSAEVNELMESFAVSKSGAILEIEPASVSRRKARILVRSLFASMEGQIFAMKQLAVAADAHNSLLTVDELAMCNECVADLKSDGSVTSRIVHPRFKENVRFAFIVLAKALHVPVELDCDCIEWTYLTQSIGLRNRLVHPKGRDDLEISDEELRRVILAYSWFGQQLSAVLKTHRSEIELCGEFFRAITDRITSTNGDA